MKNNKWFPIILVSLSCVLFIIAIVLVLNTNYFRFSNQTETNKNANNQTKEQITNDNILTSEQENNSLTVENTNISEEDTNKENNKMNSDIQITEDEKEEPDNETQSTDMNNEISQIVEETSTEKNVISYFIEQDESISNVSDQDDKTLRENAKDAFITVVDFIFYDEEIKGYTFDELTSSAKLQIIKLALSIDHKIDEYFPDYKDVIKDKYDNIKGKLAVKYLEFTANLCDKVGEDTCNQAKEDFNAMKESFGFTWQLIKELASNGSSKVKDFYESWRDSE